MIFSDGIVSYSFSSIFPRTFILVLLFMAIPPQLHAEGREEFHWGQWSFDFSMGVAQGPLLRKTRADFTPDDLRKIVGSYNLLAPNKERQSLGIYELSQPKASLIDRNYSMNFEFRANSMIGIGGSLSSTEISAHGALSRNYITSVILFSGTNTPTPLESLVQPENFKIMINTINVFISLHLVNKSIFDPFFRFSFGLGKSTAYGTIFTEDNGSVFRWVSILGSRIAILSSLFIELKLFEAAYRIEGPGHSIVLTKESGGSLGFGVHF